jgi:hypothetical protein
MVGKSCVVNFTSKNMGPLVMDILPPNQVRLKQPTGRNSKNGTNSLKMKTKPSAAKKKRKSKMMTSTQLMESQKMTPTRKMIVQTTHF